VGPAHALVEKIDAFLRRRRLRLNGVVVAVSGGPDSVALLHALFILRDQQVISGPLVIAHLNHQLRGAESDADEGFVSELHRVLASVGTDVRLRCHRLDARARAQEEGGNLEAVARRLRYGWLAEVARENYISCVATGHTADDQAETVLHRLLRGAGLRGLAGIAPQRALAPGVEVLRPMLSVTRAEVLAYLEAAGQAFRQDSSNQSRTLTRNRIRHELLRHLKECYNPAIGSVLGRLAEQAWDVYRDQERAAAALLEKAERPRAGTLLIFDAELLSAPPRQLIREALRLVWRREGWPMGGMGFAEWERLAAVVNGEETAVDLPGRLRARRLSKVVQIGPVP
jgi:tRNA(Ile)-lysidine synthase